MKNHKYTSVIKGMVAIYLFIFIKNVFSSLNSPERTLNNVANAYATNNKKEFYSYVDSNNFWKSSNDKEAFEVLNLVTVDSLLPLNAKKIYINDNQALIKLSLSKIDTTTVGEIDIKKVDGLWKIIRIRKILK